MMWKPQSVPVWAACLLCVAPSSATGQLATPTDWRWITDQPASVISGLEPGDSQWTFVTMPPGWHITTGPGAVLFNPDFRALGRYSVEAEVFLFPGASQEEYGVLVGGTELEGPRPSYVGFVVRRDGSAAILGRKGDDSRLLIPWSRAEAVATGTESGEPVRNVLRVDVGPATAVFRVNGTEVGSVPRASGDFEGGFGFRVGGMMNLHVSSLDLTQHLAMPRRSGAP
ncbi:MAG TPA: hypothetical protein VF970_03000 [Gemmatimonadales bacterium]